MGIVLANNAKSTLSSGISSLDTTIPVTDTSSFPNVSGGDYFYATIESTNGTYEIVKVTQVNASSFVVVRAQEGTIAVPFNSGSRVELRITVQSLEDHFDSTLTAAQILAELITVDGSGSLLDADLLDGYQAAAFALLAGADFTGNVTVAGTVDFTGGSLNVGRHNLSGDASITLEFHDDGASTGTIYWYRGATNRWRLQSSESSLHFRNVGLGTVPLALNYATNTISFGATPQPSSNDGYALGAAATAWSDLFLADGGVINWNNGDVTLTHSSNAVTGAGGQLLWSYGAAAATAPARFTNTADSANNVALIIESDRATPTNYDLAWIDFYLSNSAGAQTYAGSYGMAFSDITAGSVDGVHYWRLAVNSVTTDKMYLTTSGLAPYANGGLSLGFGASAWSNLHLASGAAINFNNGDVTLTHSANFLQLEGGQFYFLYNASGTATPLWTRNSFDGAAVMALRIEGDRATPTNNDIVYQSFYLSNAAGTQTEYARISGRAADVTNASEDGEMLFGLVVAGTLANQLLMEPTRLSPLTSDGMSLGSTSRMWADLFLASGGVINWNNGDVLLTHSADLLHLTGGRFAVTQNASATTSSGQFINSTDAAAVMALRIEGDRATPATGDGVYASFYLSDSAGNQDEMGRITLEAWDVTSTSEDSRFVLGLITAGTLTNRYEFYATVFRPNVSDGVALGDTSKQWADLFLATGGVINWGNGNVTLTHSSNALAIVASSGVSSTGMLHAMSGTAIPAGGTAGAGLRVSSTSNFGVFFGSGAPTLAAAKGSLYLRSDGSTTNDRMYVNTDGSTAWTAVTTAT